MNRIINAYPLTDEQMNTINNTMSNHFKKYALDDFDYEINFLCATIMIESDPDGWYISLYHPHCSHINSIPRYRLGDSAEYQVEDAEESKALTTEERIFAEQNHDIIYKFLKCENLSIEEYYDIVVMGYLKAVKDYCRKESARQYAFSTCANRSMLDCVYKHWRMLGTEKRTIDRVAISMDKNIITDDGKESSLYDLVADTTNQYDAIECADLLESILDNLDDLQIAIIEMLMQNRTQKQICEELGIGRKKFQQNVNIIREVTKSLI